MLALPQTPHDEFVKKARVAEAAGGATPEDEARYQRALDVCPP